MGTVPSQIHPAPFACAAVQVDLADHAAADQFRRIGFDDFPHELMAGNSGEAVVSTLQLQIRVADPRA